MSSEGTKGETASRTRSTRVAGRRGAKEIKSGSAKAKAKTDQAKLKAASMKAGDKQGKERLRPGQLDGLVLGYMKKHKGRLPITATKVARGINRSSGAVGNCLGRLEGAEKVRLTDEKPRRYDLAASTK